MSDAFSHAQWLVMFIVNLFMGRMNVNYVRVFGLKSKRIIDTTISMVHNKMKGNSSNLSEYELSSGCKVGIDTHADTSCAGKHVRVLERIDGKSFSVSPFNEKYR